MKKEKLQQLGHLCAGLITMVHGFDSFESADYESAVLYLGVSVCFLILAGLHKKIVQQFLGGDVAFFLLEAVVIFYSGWQYNTKGNLVFYYVMVGAAVLYFIFALLSINPGNDMPKRRKSARNKKRRRRSSSSSGSSSRGNTATGGSQQTAEKAQ